MGNLADSLKCAETNREKLDDGTPPGRSRICGRSGNAGDVLDAWLLAEFLEA